MEMNDAPMSDVSTDVDVEVSDSGSEGLEQKSSESDQEFMKRLASHREKIKVNGEEVEVDYETMKRDYQLRQASDKKFREAAMKEKRMEEFLHILRTDPKRVLSNPNIGLDLREFAENILAEHLEEEMMDPKDRELNKYKRQLAEIEEQKKKDAQRQAAERESELREKFSSDYSNDIVTALQEARMPKTEHTVKRMAYYMHQALKQGYEMKAKDVVSMVRQDYINEQKSLFGAADEDVLADILGEENIKKLRRYEAKRLKNNGLPRTPKNQPDVEVYKKAPRNGKLTVDQWREKLKKFD